MTAVVAIFGKKLTPWKNSTELAEIVMLLSDEQI